MNTVKECVVRLDNEACSHVISSFPVTLALSRHILSDFRVMNRHVRLQSVSPIDLIGLL